MKKLRNMIVLATLAGLTFSVSPAYAQGKGKAEEAKDGKAKAEKEKKERKDKKEEKDEHGHDHDHDGHGHDHDGHGHDHEGEEDHGPAPISIEKRFEMANEKHARRIAQIDRLEELGVEKATMLREKELKRHSKSISRIHEAKTKAAGRPDGKVNSETDTRGKGRSGNEGKSEGRGE